jgi:hypothetical protein
MNKGKKKGRSVERSGPRLRQLALGYHFTNWKLATCVEPSLSFTTSSLHVLAPALLVFHTVYMTPETPSPSCCNFEPVWLKQLQKWN